MVNWSAEDVQEFKIQARKFQQEYCDLLGDRDWDVIGCYEWNIFRRKVGYGIFGPPSSTPDSDNRYTGYTKEQLNVIEKICDQLVEKLNFGTNDIHFACIFVIMKIFDKRCSVPVFKAKRPKQTSSQGIFVDTKARKYTSWADYLSNNTLEKCIYCYPTDGYYETNSKDKVCVSFGTSPACDFVSRVFSVFDSVSTVVTIATAGIGAAALCAVPIAGPIMAASAIAGASSSAYGLTRGSYSLYDRASHSQSIAFSDAEAAGCWLSIIGPSLGFVYASMSSVAKAGGLIGKAGRIALIVVKVGKLSVSGIGIVHGLSVLIDKLERKELTPLDIFQFSASVLFFTNATVNSETVNTIIQELQRDIIRSPKDDSTLVKHIARLQSSGVMHRKANVVKQLKCIKNSKDLYQIMSGESETNHEVQSTLLEAAIPLPNIVSILCPTVAKTASLVRYNSAARRPGPSGAYHQLGCISTMFVGKKDGDNKDT